MRKWVITLAAVLGLGLAAPQAQAVNINPGQSGVSLNGGIATPTGLTLIDQHTTSFNTLHVHGTLEQRVYRNDVDGTLTFRYRVTNTAGEGGEGLWRMSLTNFTGVVTDVDYLNDVAGDEFGLANRSATGMTVGVFMDLQDGETSRWLSIRTNATSYHFTGAVMIQDGDQWSGRSFAPAPEPGSMVLLGMGALGLCGSHFWRRRGAPGRK